MPTTVILLDAKPMTDPDRVEVKWGDGSGQNLFGSLDEVSSEVRAVDENEDLTKKMCLARAFNISPDLSNLNSIAGREFTFDLSNNNPIRIQ